MTAGQIAIVGAGHAGVQAAIALRSLGYSGNVVLIDLDHALPYERPPLSKGFLNGSVDLSRISLRKQNVYVEKRIDLRLGVAVEEIDRSASRLRLQGGSRLAYDKLLLAVGAKARHLNVPGSELDGIVYVRTLSDARELKIQLAASKSVTVVGAGYVGLEVAAAAAKLGKRVRVIERENRVLSRVAGDSVSGYFHKLHCANGVEFQLDQSVQRFEGNGRVNQVVTAEGIAFATDLVVIGVGIGPAQELAANAGLDCDDGILIDSSCCTSDPIIFAAGDSTRQRPVAGTRGIRLECVQNAVAQAETAARAMLGIPTPAPEVPWFWTEQYGRRLQSAGISHFGDVEVLRGDPSSDRFSVLYLRGGRLAAIDTVNNLKDFVAAKRLLSLGGRLPLAFHNPDVSLHA
ncbi:NAD(P)/FAD-dependent oxidoreductase [Ensifer aridi]|uniref:NAD(P)/FAD-dependent oxidoreductase n=1 Tax=Ensifer aridi TaxID=1708715 RepID=UPI0003F4C75E|nr:FAD-dependent oxidoreductase [Ensifer aridi]